MLRDLTHAGFVLQALLSVAPLKGVECATFISQSTLFRRRKDPGCLTLHEIKLLKEGLNLSKEQVDQLVWAYLDPDPNFAAKWNSKFYNKEYKK